MHTYETKVLNFEISLYLFFSLLEQN